ncbi:hypothetical protein [Streptomyces sp. NPDC058424]|uniref:hypothetical protein n=1 Tax=Streptomyces sp. NPDC058424 TaxID=3346491 RepID=UPI00365982EB
MQDDDRNSMPALYRAALRLRPRRDNPASDATLKLDGPDNREWFGFERGAGRRCVVNFAAKPLPLGDNVDVLVSSAPLDGRRVPQDTAVVDDTQGEASALGSGCTSHPHPTPIAAPDRMTGRAGRPVVGDRPAGLCGYRTS